MKCLVVYESMYGNTRLVAEAIGRGLTHLGQVEVAPVGDVVDVVMDDLDVLVAGGPTHVHGMTRPSTRRAAVQEAQDDQAIELDPDAPGPGLRDWLGSLAQNSTIHFAAFDTRIDKPVLVTGSAAKGITKRLKRLGYLQAVEPESFFVDDSAGPLHDGEAERAQRWARILANELIRLKRHQAATRHAHSPQQH